MAELTQQELEAEVNAAKDHIRLLYAGNPDSLILDPSGDITKQTAKSMRDVRARIGAASLNLSELQTLAYNQKAMAVIALETLTAAGADPAWLKQLQDGLDYDRKMDYAEEAIEAYEAYRKVTAIGAIGALAKLARGRAEARWRLGLPEEYHAALDALDAAWRRGDFGARTVESLLNEAAPLPDSISRVVAAGEKARQGDGQSSAAQLWDQIPSWAKGLGAVIGVLVLGNLLLGVLPSRR